MACDVAARDELARQCPGLPELVSTPGVNLIGYRLTESKTGRGMAEVYMRWQNFIDVLRDRTRWHGERTAFIFLADGEDDEQSLTFAELDARARAIAADLRRRVRSEDRALLVLPSSLDYVNAFFGCLYAGITAVTAHTPRLEGSLRERDLRRLQAIMDDARPAIVLTNSPIAEAAHRGFPEVPALSEIPWHAVDQVPDSLAERWKPSPVPPEQLAFLQYTSGSTNNPKGVMVSHANLLHNQIVMQRAYGHDETTRIVSWLPLFHDMGLIGQMLHAVYLGGMNVFMSPDAFVARPVRWLQAMSRFRGTSALAPNFGYDICVRKTSAAERATLDLSSWSVAGNASEPVRALTLRQFARTFSSSGFRKQAFFPSYGLAEATLIVTAGPRAGAHWPRVTRVLAADLDRNQFTPANESTAPTRLLASSGPPCLHQVEIVDPRTNLPAAPGVAGEIWIRGESVTQGYWQRPDETEATFHARLADGRNGDYLRTGDLGFLHRGHLYVAGRLKDLIILHGTNHYPQDIEGTLDACHPAVRPGCGAAFSVDIDGEERLVIFQEVNDQAAEFDAPAVISSIRHAVAHEHSLIPYAVRLLPPRTIWKTTSGKIQRGRCRQDFLEATGLRVAEWTHGEDLEVSAPHESPRALAPESAADSLQSRVTWNADIENVVLNVAAKILGVDASALDAHQPLVEYGLDSAAAVSIADELDRVSGCEISPTLAYDFPSIRAMARRLAEILKPEQVSKLRDGFLAEMPPADTRVDASSFDASILPRDQRRAETPRSDAPRDSFVETIPRTKPLSQHSDENSANVDVAIVGMACRFPGARDIDAYWRLLSQARDAIRRFPDDRAFDPESRGERDGTFFAGLVDDIEQFEPAFFSISPREAAQMDPQQRLLLEVAWEALESASTAGSNRLSNSGVFVGVSLSEYLHYLRHESVPAEGHVATGNYLSIIANRLSYLLDFHGPSLAVDTACSSSLVAVHLAAQSLIRSECDLAVAGGVQVLLDPKLFLNFERAGMLANDGRCKTFDARANGYVRGEGAGAVVLKRLEDAIRDRDYIHAVLKGSAVNQDGRTNGLTAPSGVAQADLLRKAYATASVDPMSVGHVEAHGTGTRLGDPIELNALTAFFRSAGLPEQRCAIGTAKTNIGHLEAAAGMAGLIKTVLMLERRQLLPSLNFESPNPHLRFERSPFYLNDRLRPWMASNHPRRAGVSSFGFGGTNAHVVLEEATVLPEIPKSHARPWHLCTLSANHDQSLAKLAQNLANHLRENPDLDVGDVCYSMNIGRTHRRRRLAIACDSLSQLVDRLGKFTGAGPSSDYILGNARSAKPAAIAFVFTNDCGNWSMVRELLRSCDPFALRLRTITERLEPFAGVPLHPLMSALSSDSAEDVAGPWNANQVQAFAFCASLALAEQWKSWGIEPEGVLGIRQGEWAAACFAGAISERDALQCLLAAVDNRRHGFANIQPRPLAISYVSATTGEQFKPGETIRSETWSAIASNNSTVALDSPWIHGMGVDFAIELGMPSAVSEPLRQSFSGSSTTWLPGPRSAAETWRMIVEALAHMYACGVNPDWKAFDAAYSRSRVPLPTYPFHRQRCWFTHSTGIAIEQSLAGLSSAATLPSLWQPDDRSTPRSPRRETISCSGPGEDRPSIGGAGSARAAGDHRRDGIIQTS
ncbi:MAG: beta-ketoacyl synthase N-terminal-like domain-containing protein [Planctomycetota bacterium]